MGGEGGGVSSREQRSRAGSRRGWVSENWIAGSAAARLFFLTAIAIAIAIAIATRPFKFHEISVSYMSSSLVSSIHSLVQRPVLRVKEPKQTDVRSARARSTVRFSLAAINTVIQLVS